ncbi:MAG: polyprenol monophosphomannose synthase [Nitrososphaerales archaeon]
MQAHQKLCAVVPTYNERENVERLVEEVRRAAVSGLTLLFVDDTSPDGTGDIIREISSRDPSVKLLVRGAKTGIGSAYQDGFREAILSIAPDIIIEMDADLQHPPSVIGELVRAVQAGADVAVGSRYVAGGGVSGWSLWRRTVSRGANAYARTMLRIKVRDATSGFRAYTRAKAEQIADAALPARGFEFQVASLHLLRERSRFTEVPYTFAARTAGRSKMGLVDMARFFFSVFRIALS